MKILYENSIILTIIIKVNKKNPYILKDMHTHPHPLTQEWLIMRVRGVNLNYYILHE